MTLLKKIAPWLIMAMCAAGIVWCLHTAAVETVELTPPEVRVSNTAAGIAVAWDPVEGANRYRLTRKAQSGEWELLFYTTETKYVDRDTESGLTYQYRVYPCINNYKGDPGKAVRMMRLSRPGNGTVTSGDGTVVLEWSAVKGAECYSVFRSTDGVNFRRLPEDVRGTRFEDADVVPGQEYWYKVKATAEGRKYASASSEVLSAVCEG